MPAAKQKMAEEAFLELGTVAENGKRPKTEIGKEVIIKWLQAACQKHVTGRTFLPMSIVYTPALTDGRMDKHRWYLLGRAFALFCDKMDEMVLTGYGLCDGHSMRLYMKMKCIDQHQKRGF